MDLLYSRPTYSRARTDEPIQHEHEHKDAAVELSSLHTKTTYSSSSHYYSGHRPLSETGSAYRLLPDSHHDELASSPSDVRGRRKIVPTGWRVGAMSAAFVAVVSLSINVAVVVWLKTHPGSDFANSLVEVYVGDCDLVRRMGLWVHLFINAISTLLLAGSNYCMQCLSSPTRAEVDEAHSRGKYLDIGVPSIRNLRTVATRKVVLWWILSLSSVPLHLLYNSAFYGSLSANDYDIFVTTPEFADGANFTVTSPSFPATVKPVPQGAAGSFHRLDTDDCIAQYAQAILTNRRNLILVSSNSTATDLQDLGSNYLVQIQSGADGYLPFDWICSSDPWIDSKIEVPWNAALERSASCDTYVSEIERISLEWMPYGYNISYCLSEQIAETCSFNGNIPIILTVIFCNAIKALIMLVIAFGLRERPLITIGDAIESFLDSPDVTTKGRCWMTRGDVAHFESLPESSEAKLWPVRSTSVGHYSPAHLSTEGKRWQHAASKGRWILTIGLVALALSVSVVFLGLAAHYVNKIGVNILSLGIGQVHAAAVISGWAISNIADPAQQVLASILVANLPQAILSFLYLNLNGLLTSMWVAAEWSDFVIERKHLRVSNPHGDQRSTYFLQLPYKVAMPLMVISGLLHWLVSQSIFLAVVAEWSSSGYVVSPIAIASCGFSPIAMLITIGLGLCIILGTFLTGRRRCRDGIPLVGSCSAAISAACHPPDWDRSAASCAVQYGAIPGIIGEGGIGHCSFTSGVVEMPQKSVLYAGIDKIH